jgi:hypothetical protein
MGAWLHLTFPIDDLSESSFEDLALTVLGKQPDKRQIYDLQKIINYTNPKERVRLVIVRSGIGGDFGDFVVARRGN